VSTEDFQRQLEAISAEYRRELPAKLDAIETLWRGLSDRGSGTGSIADLRRELHSLAGSARTFGIAGVSEAAATAESFLEPYARRGKLPGAAQRAAFARLLESVRKAAG
jgi:chemotaxis protein histidine kinase CheA